MITNYASRTLIEEKHELDNFIITNISHTTTHSKELIIIELFYLLSNTLYNNKTPGDTIINITDTIPKTTKVLIYIIKSSIKYLSLKSPYINLISSLIDVIHYIFFIGNTNGISINYIDYIFNRIYYCNNNITSNNNTFLLKQMILNELISFIGVLFPQKQSTRRYLAIDKIHISRLCVLCKEEPSNIVLCKCGHRYCYYCYVVERENKQIQNDDDDNNNMYCFICENN